MGYPKNYIGIAVSKETHKRITNLKKEYDEETLDAVVNRLLDLEEQYNTPTETMEYELMLSSNRSKLFKITFSDKILIEYWDSKELKFEKDIKVWFKGYRLPRETLDNFIRFIIKDTNLMILYEMEKEFVGNDLWIRRTYSAGIPK